MSVMSVEGYTQETQNICITFVQCWTTLDRRCTNVIQMFCVCWVLIVWQGYLLERDVAHLLERGALPITISLTAVRFRIPFEAIYIFIYAYMFLPSQYWNIFSMLCPWARYFTLTCFTWIRFKCTWLDRDDNVYEEFNAPKWVQDCMLSVELKWHTINEKVQWPGGKM